MANKIDSNVTGLAIAEEASLKTLPGSPVWYEQEPNSYSDFGGDFSTVARAPINASRQSKKGKLVDLDASGGFNVDLTKSNMLRLLQGFFFADAREKASTKPLNGTAVAITNVDGVGEDYEAASGLGVFGAGDLVLASGFTNAENNGLKLVSSAAATSLVVSSNLVAETPPADAKIETVGFQFPTGDADLVAATSTCSLTTSVTDLTTLGLTPGEWVFIGGDSAATKFTNTNAGYARIKLISANEIIFDDATFTPASETGTTKTIQMFFGTVLRNEKDTALIKRRSYNIERQLGQDNDGVQSEYLEGAVANEFTLNIPQADKLNADLSFVALDNTHRSGLEGLKSGTRVPAATEDAYNTSSDIYRIKLSVVDDTTFGEAALFGYVSEASIVINNNVSPNKAVAVLGAFDVSAGNFDVSGSITAYFSEVAAVAAVRNNSDVSLNFIAAQKNAGFIYDIPLLGLGGGRLNVEKDNPITIPLEMSASENALGYTMLKTFFAYLPTAAMPQ